MENTRQTGTYYEQQAVIEMRRQGYLIKERNFRCRYGEVDIIAKKDGYLVFAEVKYRSSERFGTPSEAVRYQKQRRISNVSSYYIYKHKLPPDTPVRYDVVSISDQGIEIIENAFSYCGNFLI